MQEVQESRSRDLPCAASTGVPSAAPLSFLARLLSIAGHPFLVLPASVTAVSALRGGGARAGLLLGGVFLAVSLAIIAGIKAGRFNDFDVSRRERRPGFYLLVSAGTAALAVSLRGDAQAVRACLSAGALLVACGVANRWLKASLHTAFALYAVGYWAACWPGTAAVALPLASAVAWSRIHLRRHSLAEVLAGAVLGLVAGVSLLLFAG